MLGSNITTMTARNELALLHLTASEDGTLRRSAWPKAVLIFGWGSRKMADDTPLNLAFEPEEYSTEIHNLELLITSQEEPFGDFLSFGFPLNIYIFTSDCTIYI